VLKRFSSLAVLALYKSLLLLLDLLRIAAQLIATMALVRVPVPF